MRRLILVIGMTMLGAACRADPEQQRYAVYAAVLDSLFDHTAPPLRVKSVTFPWKPEILGEEMYQALRARPEVPADLWADYASANSASDTLCECFGSAFSVQLEPAVPETPLVMPDPAAPRPSPKWEPVGFSNVGFSRSRKEALVFAGQSCGYLCGNSYFLLLRKEAKGWVIAAQLTRGAS